MDASQREEVERAKQMIDEVGTKLSLRDWIDLCDEIADYFETSVAAARDDL